MLTAYGTVEDAVEAMKLGAYDFVIKTVDLDGLDQVVRSRAGAPGLAPAGHLRNRTAR